MAELMTLSDALQQLRRDVTEELGRELVCLDLGAGQRPEPGFISVDLNTEAEVCCDLFARPWPFETDSVDLIFSSHFVEHVPDWDAFWNEVYRIVRHGGIVVAMTPYWSSVRAFQDPDHKQAISEQRYAYLSRKAREGMKVDHYGADVDFEMCMQPWFGWNKDFADKSVAAKAYAKEHYLNVVEDICVFLKVIKETE
jgi:SAM-dependent methyltransferase